MSSDIDLKTLNNAQGFEISGANAGDQSGKSVNAVGDINADGIDDVIIGAPVAYNMAGASYIIFGKNTTVFDNINLVNLIPTQGFQIRGANQGDQSGNSVSGAGDINADGIDDIIIGVPSAYSSAGVSYIIFGKNTTVFDNINLANLTSTQGFQIRGANQGDVSGCAVSSIGDINGDGIGDIILGAYGAYSHAGASYVIFGKNTTVFDGINLANLVSTQGFQILGANVDDLSGWVVSAAGDINVDGIDDVIIGAYSAYNFAGASYVIFGRNTTVFDNINLANLTSTQGFQIRGANVDDRSGWAVSAAGDINADGIDDVIIAAYSAYNMTGASYVVFGRNTTVFDNINLVNLVSTQGFQIRGANAGDQSGNSVSGVGDINVDGIDDVIIGAFAAYNFAGASYVIYNTKLPVPPAPSPWWEPYLEIGLPIVGGIALIGAAMFGWYKYNHCNSIFNDSPEQTGLINQNIQESDVWYT